MQSEAEVLVEFGQRIVRLRRRKGWAQAELAQRLGVTRERLGHWERGECNPPLDALLALGRVLGIPLDELAGGEPAPLAGLSRATKEKAVSHMTAALKLLR